MISDFRKVICVVIAAVMLILVGCTTSIETPSDELVASNWYAKLENNNEIKLCFLGDEASMEFVFSDKEKLSISGFCEVSDSQFVIYDEITKTPYVFDYIVHFDRVFVKYFTNTVSLYKI